MGAQPQNAGRVYVDRAHGVGDGVAGAGGVAAVADGAPGGRVEAVEPGVGAEPEAARAVVHDAPHAVRAEGRRIARVVPVAAQGAGARVEAEQAVVRPDPQHPSGVLMDRVEGSLAVAGETGEAHRGRQHLRVAARGGVEAQQAAVPGGRPDLACGICVEVQHHAACPSGTGSAGRSRCAGRSGSGRRWSPPRGIRWGPRGAARFHRPAVLKDRSGRGGRW